MMEEVPAEAEAEAEPEPEPEPELDAEAQRGETHGPFHTQLSSCLAQACLGIMVDLSSAQ